MIKYIIECKYDLFLLNTNLYYILFTLYIIIYLNYIKKKSSYSNIYHNIYLKILIKIYISLEKGYVTIT